MGIFNVMIALTLISLAISGVIYSEKGFNKYSKYVLYAGLTCFNIYFLLEIFPFIILFCLDGIDEILELNTL